METETKLTWNYKIPESAKYAEQSDWNQTLLTKINEIAASVIRNNYTGKKVPEIIVSPTKLRPIIESLIYYDKTTHMIANRFTVIFIEMDSNNFYVCGKELEIENYKAE